MEYVYHGSKESGLKSLKPSKAGYNKKYVYAATDISFAAIFINKPGGSLVAKYKRDEASIPYYCERKRGIFNKNYSKQKGSIYVLEKEHFKHLKNLWSEELVSEKEVPVVKEIKIKDLKKFLLDLEKEGKFRVIYYKDRLKHFPRDDIAIERTKEELVKKYGKGVLDKIKWAL